MFYQQYQHSHHHLIGYFLYLILLFSDVKHVYGGHRFGYTEPDQRRWVRQHSQCGGKFQSPIAIYSEKAQPVAMPAIELVGYHNLLPGPLIIHNNGHSVSMSVPKVDRNQKQYTTTSDKLPYIFGGKLDSEYEVEGLHFHWGDKNNRGSEHVLNGIRYPMEMHIIHRNKKYADVTEALKHSDGLCVLGFFYQLKENDGPELTNIVRNITVIEDYDKTVKLNFTFALSTLIGNIDTERFYTYRGSLTTPPCSEAVRWVLFPDTLQVSVTQMNRFRELSNGIEGSLLVDNYRTLQPLNNRQIFVRKVNTQNTELSDLPDVHYSEWDWIKSKVVTRNKRNHHHHHHHHHHHQQQHQHGEEVVE